MRRTEGVAATFFEHLPWRRRVTTEAIAYVRDEMNRPGFVGGS
jgi:hypothetical protein